MAAVICPQCGAQLSDGPTAPGEAVAVQRCRFCGHAFDGGSGEAVPPAAPALAGPPAAPPGQPSRAPRAVDPLTVPFDMPGDGDGAQNAETVSGRCAWPYSWWLQPWRLP
jgi:rubredoxin